MAFWRLYYHVVWATKNREPLITPEIEPRLYGYIVNKAAELGAYVYEINGSVEHAHVVLASPPQLAISDLVKEMKGASSHDVNQQRVLDYHFAWQRGYGVISLGQRQKAEAEAYVRNQKEHHRQQTTMEWLERTNEFDEGPLDFGAKPKVAVPRLREEGVVYDILGEPPF